jgi:CheY-like chemotaxis protein
MGRTVLVVDDEPDIRVLARVALQSAGYRVIEASSGQEALAAIETEGPDVALLDIRMPDMDGWEVLDKLRHADLLDDLRVVMCSAHEMASGPEWAREKGAAGFLPKPFMPEELVEAVGSAVGEHAPAPDATVVHGDLQAALTTSLLPDERVELDAEALVRVTMAFFHRCLLCLTDQRLIVLKPAWPWGYRVSLAIDRDECVLDRIKKKIDGSTLVVIKHPRGIDCFYLSRHWKEQAETLERALSSPSASRT